ncbi:MAG: hypothetical protein QOC71_1115, partial [Thermoplasmata archaeon]|nr:hypothetical protein [Thermoplasmata archaeon]
MQAPARSRVYGALRSALFTLDP